jgi:DNA-directed RNA polymerase specialized sigma24 family protein
LLIKSLAAIVTPVVSHTWEKLGLGQPSTLALETVHDEVWDILLKNKPHYLAGSYISTIARRRAHRRAYAERRQQRLLARASSEMGLLHCQPSVEDIVDARMALERASLEWLALNPSVRQCLVGMFSAMTAKEISRATGMSISGVQKRIRQGREKLRYAARGTDASLPRLPVETMGQLHVHSLVDVRLAGTSNPLLQRGIH